MGGRGGSSGLPSSVTQAFSRAGVRMDDMEKLDARAVEQSLKGVHDVLRDMEIPLSAVNMICGKETSEELMAVNGCGDLIFSKSVYSNIEKAKEDTKNKNGYFASGGLYSVGAHEAGHIAVDTIMNRIMRNNSVLERAKARKNHKISKQILREAGKQYGSNPEISKYGEKSASEKVAEAVSDVYTNKSKANPYSKVIVNILKKKLNGE